MSEYQHAGLAAGRWAEMSLAEQMLNIGSEVSRANRWKSKGNLEQCHPIQPNLFPYVRKSSYLCKRILGMKYLKS